MPDKSDSESMLNPKLKISSYIIGSFGVLIFYAGIQYGLIGGAISGALAYSLSSYGIRLIAKHKKIPLLVKKPDSVKEDEVRIKKKRVNFWKKFALIWILIFVGVFLLSKVMY